MDNTITKAHTERLRAYDQAHAKRLALVASVNLARATAALAARSAASVAALPAALIERLTSG